MMSRLRSLLGLRLPSLRSSVSLGLLVLTVAGGMVARERLQLLAEHWTPAELRASARSGKLFLAGGGDLPDRVLRRFAELSGGPKAKLVVIPGAAVNEGRRLEYANTWRALGVGSVTVLHAESRSQAEDPAFSRVLETATGVWLGGGQQTWFSAWYRGTPVETRLKALLERGGVVGGTSAGASAMTDVMIAGGRWEPLEGHGLGLFPEAIVDQHFLKRNRAGRMMRLLERYPDLVGLGIDEGTALEVDLGTRRLAVVGASYVMAYRPGQDGVAPHVEFLKAGDSVALADLRAPEPETELVPGWIADHIMAAP